jgi:hypothetical protein
LPRKLRRDDLLRRDAARVEFFNAAQLIGFETLCVAVYVADVKASLSCCRALRRAKHERRAFVGRRLPDS